MSWLDQLETGKVVTLARESAISEQPWLPRLQFKGVYIKHLITGEATQGQFSCHLVKVEAGGELGWHTHEGKWELHEVVGGCGTGFLAEQEIAYVPGTDVVVPPDVPHRILAGEEPLYILAKFVPALL